MANEFENVMSRHSDDELIAILSSSPDDYQPAALDAARKEFIKRNLSDARIKAVKELREDREQAQSKKAGKPLNLHWKILSFVFPGVIPLIVAWSFKADGYNRKAKEVVIWTVYGFVFYIGLVIISSIW